MEWTAKLCILLPVCLSGKSLGSFILCIILGTAAWGLFLLLIIRYTKSGESFFEQLSRSMGKMVATVFFTAGILYFLAQAAVFTNLCGELAALYLLPEISVRVLCLLPIVAAAWLGRGTIEVRGRFCEVTGPVVLGMMALMTSAAAWNSPMYGGESTLVSIGDRLPGGSFEVFACMGGCFLPLLLLQRGPDTPSGRVSATIRRAGIFSAVLSGVLCAAAAAVYGRNGMQMIDFPAIRVMSNIKIPGGFLQRWDILFLSLLLAGMTVTVSGALWYIWEMIAVLYTAWYPGRAGLTRQSQKTSCAAGNKWITGFRISAVVLVYFLAAGFLNAYTAICYYRAWNLQILTPLLLALYAASGIRSRLRLPAYRKIYSSGRKVKRSDWKMHASGRKVKLSDWKMHASGRKVKLSDRKTHASGRNVKLPGRNCCPKDKEGRRAGAHPGISVLLVFGILLAAAVCFLGGCTAREPEERLFPMALEIGVQEGELTVTYAWNEGQGPARSYSGEEEQQDNEGKNGEAEMQGGADSDSADQSAAEDLVTLRGSSLEDIHRQEAELTERYMDYSHVKAVILRDSLRQAPELEADVMRWLAQETAFASGLIVYRSSPDVLTLAQASERSSGQIGKYLENLYKNSEKYRESATTLGNVIASYYAEIK